MIRSFCIAFSMYSRLPVPHTEWTEDDMRYVMCFFPLIGAVIGLVLIAWTSLAAHWEIGKALFAGVAAVIPAVLTGGIHLDGFCDTLDALGSRQPMERKLEILKDSNSGAFAVMGCCIYFLLLFCLWQEWALNGKSLCILAVGFVLSRVLSGLSVVCFPCAKNSGLLAMFSHTADKRRTAWVLAAYLVLSAAFLLLVDARTGAAVLIAALAAFGYYRWMSVREFGGTTGDLAGWFLQLCELAILLAAVIVQKI
nr:adenosylcobinamide-GDP ribazoletransferase [Clostridium sp. D33t1_170424_F3]